MIALDIGSHWIHMYNSLVRGEQSHKKIDPSKNYFLYLYYTSRVVLFLMCAGNELFFGSLYILHFTEGPMIPGLDIGFWRIVLYISTPVSFVKNCISVIQMVDACKELAARDVAAREAQKKKK